MRRLSTLLFLFLAVASFGQAASDSSTQVKLSVANIRTDSIRITVTSKQGCTAQYQVTSPNFDTTVKVKAKDSVTFYQKHSFATVSAVPLSSCGGGATTLSTVNAAPPSFTLGLPIYFYDLKAAWKDAETMVVTFTTGGDKPSLFLLQYSTDGVHWETLKDRFAAQADRNGGYALTAKLADSNKQYLYLNRYLRLNSSVQLRKQVSVTALPKGTKFFLRVQGIDDHYSTSYSSILVTSK